MHLHLFALRARTAPHPPHATPRRATPPACAQVTKGAPHIILKLVADAAEVVHAVECKVTELGTRGIRALAVARTNPAKAGAPVRPRARACVCVCGSAMCVGGGS